MTGWLESWFGYMVHLTRPCGQVFNQITCDQHAHMNERMANSFLS